MIRISLSILMLVFVLGCANDATVNQSSKPTEILKTQCEKNPDHAYHYAVPQSDDTNFPLILAIDAHGNGKVAVEKIQEALFFPAIVIGDNLIKNGDANFYARIDEVYRDAMLKFPVDTNQVILAGFSGGARMVSTYAMSHEVKGVLMLGAGPPRDLPQAPVYAVVGMGDFNFHEVYYRPEVRVIGQKRFLSDVFEGNHEWPPVEHIQDGFRYFFKDELLTENANNRSAELIQQANDLKSEGNYLMAWKCIEKAAKINADSTREEALLEEARLLVRNKDMRTSMQAMEKSLGNEKIIRGIYFRQTEVADIDWWENEIDALNMRIDTSSAAMERYHYARLKSFMGVLLFNKLNQFVNTDKQNSSIPVLLDAFEYLEPDNPDVYKFRATYADIKGDSAAMVHYMDMALEKENLTLD